MNNNSSSQCVCLQFHSITTEIPYYWPMTYEKWNSSSIFSFEFVILAAGIRWLLERFHNLMDSHSPLCTYFIYSEQSWFRIIVPRVASISIDARKSKNEIIICLDATNWPDSVLIFNSTTNMILCREIPCGRVWHVAVRKSDFCYLLFAFFTARNAHITHRLEESKIENIRMALQSRASDYVIPH